MAARVCPVCGAKTLREKHGAYRMSLPPTSADDFVVVPDATWLHCDSCREDILSAELEQAINRHCGESRIARQDQAAKS